MLRYLEIEKCQDCPHWTWEHSDSCRTYNPQAYCNADFPDDKYPESTWLTTEFRKYILGRSGKWIGNCGWQACYTIPIPMKDGFPEWCPAKTFSQLCDKVTHCTCERCTGIPDSYDGEDEE